MNKFLIIQFIGPILFSLVYVNKQLTFYLLFNSPIDIVPTIQALSDKTTTIEEGKPMELSITVADVQSATWLYNGKKITSRDIKLNEEGNNYTLYIARMRLSNAGLYTFQATSPTGHVIKEVFDVTFQGLINRKFLVFCYVEFYLFERSFLPYICCLINSNYTNITYT
jgi:Immunoglobulin I-set domain.